MYQILVPNPRHCNDDKGETGHRCIPYQFRLHRRNNGNMTPGGAINRNRSLITFTKYQVFIGRKVTCVRAHARVRVSSGNEFDHNSHHLSAAAFPNTANENAT